MSDITKPEKVALTTRESELVVIAMQCLKESGIKLNWDKFTKIAEYKNANSARTNFQTVVKKLSEGTVDKFYVAQSSSLTPAVPKKRGGKGKASDAPNPTDANDNVEAGALKKRGRKLKALATDEADGNASGIENGNAKKRPRTKKLAAESAYDHGSRLHDAKVYTTERKSESPATKRIKTSPDADVKVKDEDDTAANGLNTTVEGDESSGTAEDTVES